MNNFIPEWLKGMFNIESYKEKPNWVDWDRATFCFFSRKMYVRKSRCPWIGVLMIIMTYPLKTSVVEYYSKVGY